jgi:hypothetical protein
MYTSTYVGAGVGRATWHKENGSITSQAAWHVCILCALLPVRLPSTAFPQPGYFPCLFPSSLSLCVHASTGCTHIQYRRSHLRRPAPDSIARPPPCHVPSCAVLPGISTAPGAPVTHPRCPVSAPLGAHMVDVEPWGLAGSRCR